MALIANLVIGLSTNTRRMERGFSRSNRLVSGFKRRLAALATGAGLFALVRGTEQFNQAMLKSLSIMSGVNEAIRTDMEATARDVASNTMFSATQAAKSYFFLASAGLSVEQSLAALPAVAKFAQAGMFDMATATDLLTDAQSALGLSVKDPIQNLKNMVRVSDVLADANKNANASIQQFSEALTNKAAVALRNLGKDVEEGVAILAVFADQGLKGSEAGTALNIVFRDLEQSATKNAKAFALNGVAVFDVAGEMRNMADIIADLERTLDGASDAQKTLTLAQLGFPAKSQAFIKALLGSSEAIREYEANARNAAGTTAEIADKMLTPFQKGMAKLTGQLGRLTDAVIQPMIDLLGLAAEGWGIIFEKVFDFLGIGTAAEDKTKDIAKEMDGAAQRTKDWAAEIDNVGGALGDLEEKAGRGIGIVKNLRDQIADFGKSDFQKDLRKARLEDTSLQQLGNIKLLHEELQNLKDIESAEKDLVKTRKKAAADRVQAERDFLSLAGPSGAAVAGGTAALSIINQIQRSAMPTPANLATDKQSLDELTKQTRLLTGIDRKLDNQPKVAAI